MTASDAYCERCRKVKPTTRPAPDVIDEDGEPVSLCDECWFKTKPDDDRKGK